MRNNFGSWVVTPAVEYFHVLPYVGIVSDWFSRCVIVLLSAYAFNSLIIYVVPVSCRVFGIYVLDFKCEYSEMLKLISLNIPLPKIYFFLKPPI